MLEMRLRKNLETIDSIDEFKEMESTVIMKILKVTLLLLLVAVCGVGYMGWFRIRSTRLDLDNVELMADPAAAMEVDQDILDEIVRRKKAESRVKDEETEAGNSLSELRIVDPKEVVWKNEKLSALKDKNLVNFLLIDQAQKKGVKRQPADLILVCSFHLESQKIVLFSIDKDLYVQIPGYQDNKIGAAYQIGGMKLMDQVIEKNLGLSITHNLGMDFETILSYFPELKTAAHESAEEKMACIQEILPLLEDKKPTELLEMANRLLSDVVTDLGPLDFLKYAKEVIACDKDNVKECSVPTEECSERVLLTIGMEVLLPDLEKNQKELRKAILE